ncbi:MAG: DUF4065 domain-containing protein [Phycisphaeraceae bacterium]|nr:MAG: DUF4065 domain-containing protein [Phycisphaeraceae bacterium]
MTRPNSTFNDAKRLIAAIIQTAGGSYNGRVRLYKVFYDAHLFYWKRHGRYLTSHPIVRMPNGPGIDQGEQIIRSMIAENTLKASQHPVGPYTEDVYVYCGDSIELDPNEVEAITSALNWVGDKTGVAISKESHDRSRTWRETPDGRELHIYLDVASDDETESLRSSVESVRRDLREVFG